jgi:hypothetical protein
VAARPVASSGESEGLPGRDPRRSRPPRAATSEVQDVGVGVGGERGRSAARSTRREEHRAGDSPASPARRNAGASYLRRNPQRPHLLGPCSSVARQTARIRAPRATPARGRAVSTEDARPARQRQPAEEVTDHVRRAHGETAPVDVTRPATRHPPRRDPGDGNASHPRAPPGGQQQSRGDQHRYRVELATCAASRHRAPRIAEEPRPRLVANAPCGATGGRASRRAVVASSSPT